MSKFEVIMPKLGESIQEGTITKWFVKEGDTVEEDDMLFEVATDKVDSEIPSPVDGVVTKILHPVDSLVPVGEVVALLNMEGEEEESPVPETEKEEIKAERSDTEIEDSPAESLRESRKRSNRFYSPLVKTIAREENVTLEELENIQGSGANGRIQKKDILEYIDKRK